VCETSTSNYFLNTIGVTKQDCLNVITKDYATIEAFVNDKIEASTLQTAASVNSEFSKDYITGKISRGSRHFQTGTIQDGARLGFAQKNKDLKSLTSEGGIHLKMQNGESYLRLHISELALFLNHSGPIDVKIYDLYTEKVLATETITAVAGEKITVYPDISIDSFQQDLDLFIGYDTLGTIDSYDTRIRAGACCGDYSCRHHFTVSQGAEITSGNHLNEDILGITHTAGLSMVYSISCNHQGWLCNHAAALSLPILYKTAAEIMLHGLHTSPNQRAHNTQTLDRDILKERHQYYEDKHTATLEQVLGGLQLPQDPRCFQCTPSTRHIIALP